MSNTPSSLNGIIFMLFNTMALACIDTTAKILNQELSTALVVFLYKFSLLVIILPWIFSDGLKVLKTKRLIFHLLRGALSVFGAICFFQGIKTVNMGEAAVLENVQYLLLSIVGIIFFKEKITAARIFAIFTGIVGACIVIKPDLLSLSLSNTMQSEFNFGYIYILCAMLFWTSNTITIKVLGTTESNKTQMFYLLFFASIFGGFSVLVQWSTVEVAGYNLVILPNLTDLSKIELELQHYGWLLIMAIFYFIHGISYFNALKSDLSLVVPFRYSKMVFSALLSYLVFNELQHDSRSYIGYAMIILASLILLQDEIRRKKRHRLQKAKGLLIKTV